MPLLLRKMMKIKNTIRKRRKRKMTMKTKKKLRTMTRFSKRPRKIPRKRRRIPMEVLTILKKILTGKKLLLKI